MDTDPEIEPRHDDQPDPVVLTDATKTFEESPVLRGADLRVPMGAIVGLIGPSGAGKTTAVRLMTGAISPDSGTVRVLGVDPTRATSAERGRIGYMPQLPIVYRELTVRENVDFIASLYGLFFLRRRRRTRAVLEAVDLWAVRGRRASDLSGGMLRRLELACALVHRPPLLFLDEPTAGLDPLLRARIWEGLHQLRSEGTTIVVTTQYLEEAAECDRVALIADGRIVADAEPDALRRQAIGGDRVVLETDAPIDGATLRDLPFVRAILNLDPKGTVVVVDDAATAGPALVEGLKRQGVAVLSVREDRPTFDEVFAELMRRTPRPDDASVGTTESAA
jgi:ABC-2 type transport system ATP-binding protein